MFQPPPMVSTYSIDTWTVFFYNQYEVYVSFQEAKALPGVGAKLAEKIWEIVESGELRKLNELTSQEDIKTLDLFTGKKRDTFPLTVFNFDTDIIP